MLEHLCKECLVRWRLFSEQFFNSEILMVGMICFCLSMFSWRHSEFYFKSTEGMTSFFVWDAKFENKRGDHSDDWWKRIAFILLGNTNLLRMKEAFSLLFHVLFFWTIRIRCQSIYFPDRIDEWIEYQQRKQSQFSTISKQTRFLYSLVFIDYSCMNVPNQH